MTRSPQPPGSSGGRRRKPGDGRDKIQKKSKKRGLNSDWVVNYLLVVSSIVWVANFTIGVFVASYKGSETVNAVFLAVIGGIFTLKTKQKADEAEDEE